MDTNDKKLEHRMQTLLPLKCFEVAVDLQSIEKMKTFYVPEHLMVISLVH